MTASGLPPRRARGKCSDWRAWREQVAGGTTTLHVEGQCEFETAGYKVELRPVVPQGTNPNVYILERVVKKPTGPVADVVTRVDVIYQEQTDAAYTHIQIRPARRLIEVRTKADVAHAT